MRNRARTVPAIALLAALAVAGCGGASPATGGGATSGASSGPASPAVATPSSAAPASPPTATDAPSGAASPSSAASPAASASGLKPATVTFTGLKLDASDDPSAAARTFTWASQGAGTITVSVKATTPMGDAVLCLRTPAKKLGCTTTGSGKLTAKTTKPSESFQATLLGSGTETPVVDVTLTFPATEPSVTLENARFDGTDYPDTNGIRAVVTPRADGNLTLKAAWGGHPFPYEVDLAEQGGSGGTTLANQGPAISADVSLPVTAPNPWAVTLQNVEGGFGITPMTVTLAWP